MSEFFHIFMVHSCQHTTFLPLSALCIPPFWHAFKLGNPCPPAQDSTNHSQDSMCGVMGQRKLVFPMGLPHLPTSLYA